MFDVVVVRRRNEHCHVFGVKKKRKSEFKKSFRIMLRTLKSWVLKFYCTECVQGAERPGRACTRSEHSASVYIVKEKLVIHNSFL